MSPKDREQARSQLSLDLAPRETRPIASRARSYKFRRPRYEPRASLSLADRPEPLKRVPEYNAGFQGAALCSNW